MALAGAGMPGQDYGQLVVTGEVALAGQLELTLEAFAPTLGDTFQVITGAVVRGEFAHADGMIERGGHHFRIHRRPSYGRLRDLYRRQPTPR